MARQPETNFKIRALARLNNIPNSWFFKTQMRSLLGIPDVIGVVNGYFVALELKTDKGRPSRIQLYVIDLIKKAGGFVSVVTPTNFEAIVTELEEFCGF